MKIAIQIFVLMITMMIGLGCNPQNLPENNSTTHMAACVEILEGVIVNVNGEPLEKIMLQAYYDKALKKSYPFEGAYSFTNSEGKFGFKAFTERSSLEPFDIYIVAIDTIAGTYQTQVQKGQIKSFTYIDENGKTKWAGGRGEVNFILKTK